MARGKLGGEGLQPVLAAGDEDQIVAAGGQGVGEGGPDAGRGAGDQRQGAGGLGQVGHSARIGRAHPDARTIAGGGP